jgi:hypothetical protein
MILHDIPYRKLQALGLTFIIGRHFCLRNSFACWRPRVVVICQVIVSGCPELLELKRIDILKASEKEAYWVAGFRNLKYMQVLSFI